MKPTYLILGLALLFLLLISCQKTGSRTTPINYFEIDDQKHKIVTHCFTFFFAQLCYRPMNDRFYRKSETINFRNLSLRIEWLLLGNPEKKTPKFQELKP